MKISTTIHCLTLSFSVALGAIGCQETAATTERSADRPTVTAPLADLSDPTALSEDDFAALQERRGAFVRELLSYQPVVGRDRALHFTQPAWAEEDAAVVIFHLLRDPAVPAERRAALALRLRTNKGAWAGPAIAALQREPSERVRASLMSALADATPPAVVQATVLGLADASPVVRDWATFAASRVLADHSDAPGTSEVVAALTGHVKDDNAEVRAGTFRALGLARNADLLDTLALGLQDPNARVRARALSAIIATAPSKALTMATDAGLATDDDPAIAPIMRRLASN